MGNVIISPNIKKTSERLDFNGNTIDPKTKQILVPREVESVLPPPKVSQTIAPQPPRVAVVNQNSTAGGLSILDQIEEAKRNLQALEELKKLKIAEKKAELELLQQ